MANSSEEDLTTVLILGILHRRRQRRRIRTVWVRPLFTRRHQGEYHNLLQELRLSDPNCHFKYLRMSRERFDCLLAEVSYCYKSF